MREIFEDVLRESPLDPMESARRSMRPGRKRFYTDVDVVESNGAFQVRLDAKPIRTPARRVFALPMRALAERVADEWRAQEDTVDPARMPLTRLANTIIDGVSDAVGEVADDVAKYLSTDLLFYRAEGPERLVAKQSAEWDPVLAWAHDELGAQFFLAAGVMHVAQPERAVAAASAHIPREPWRLGALHAVTTLTGSALLALAVLKGRLSAADAWAVAHVDEDWQMGQWGEDELAMQRRAFRWSEMEAAAAVIDALRDEPQ